MRRLRTQLHLLEARYDDAARPLPAVHRDEIEVAAGVQRPGRRLAAVALLEDEKLHLAPDAHRKAQLAGPLDLPLQGGPGAPLERPAVRVADVADEPRHGSSGLSVARLAGRALPGKHAGSGTSRACASSTRANPSSAEPSNSTSPAKACSNREAGTSTALFTPNRSVNCSSRKRTRPFFSSSSNSRVSAAVVAMGIHGNGR